MADTTSSNYSTEELLESQSLLATEELLAPLRESILNKPHYISGKLQLTTSCFSLFYKVTKDGSAARFEVLGSPTTPH
jgi:hypothetical protein